MTALPRPGPDLPSVAVLVELVRGPTAGGHVKCWERFAEAAAALDPADLGVDLTVYFLGERERVHHLSPAVRTVALRPMLTAAPLLRLVGGVDMADLAPYHPRLARLLHRHNVWHVTHAFAFASTARRLRRRLGTAGMVASVHTDVPALTFAYVRRMIDGLPPLRLAADRVPARYCPDVIAGLIARRHRDRLLRACDRVLVATSAERAELAPVVGGDRVSLFGLGVDHERFRPDPDARARLARDYGIPVERPVVLFAGRVDASKRVLVLAEAVRRLLDGGRKTHLVVAGSGADAGRVRALLGRNVTLLGSVPQDRLARIYPGCDVLALPSRTETAGCVVAEAMACGLPVVLPSGARTTSWLASPGQDGLVVPDDDAQGWAAQLARLVDQPGLRAAVGARARVTARVWHRPWGRVLAEDLVPVWHEVATRRPSVLARTPRSPTASPRGAGTGLT